MVSFYKERIHKMDKNLSSLDNVDTLYISNYISLYYLSLKLDLSNFDH